jgi:site-specific recombinase XerD
MALDAKIREVNESPAGWLQPHRKRFLEGLAAQGYRRCSLWSYDRAIMGFCATIKRRGLSSGDLIGRPLERLRQTTVEQFKPKLRAGITFRLNRFINHLAEVGVATLPKPRQKAPTALERLREDYETYLRHQRGLSDATIKKSLEFLKRFMTFHFEGRLGDLNSITPGDIVAFLREIRARAQPYRDKTPPTHLRSLFRYLFWSGKTKRDLANAIPRVALPPQSHLPRHLNPKAVEQIIDAIWSGDPVGLRNYAMILLTARLGLRAPEVIAIQLDDIDWRAGTILIRGKGKRHERMPLPKDVGRAIVDYIRKARRGSSRTLFVSSKVPYPPFVNARILNTALSDGLKRTGLKPPQKYVGSHLLRHSLAIDMLRKGASLDEIGDVLRHRSRMSTTIYAKHDVQGLRSIARAWPVEGGRA